MNSEIFIPHCIRVAEIETIKVEACYQFFPVYFKYNNIKKLAFVDNIKILCDNAIITPCQFNNHKIYLDDSISS